MTNGECIAANVARLRQDRQLTQGQLAARAGISRLALGKIERGTVVPRAGTLQGLAAALEVPVGELVTRVRALESVRFRAKARVHGREQILAVVSKWLDAYSRLEAELNDRPAFRFAEASAGGGTPVEVARGAFPISRSRAHTHRRHGHPLQTVPSAGLIERPQEKNRVDALR